MPKLPLCYPTKNRRKCDRKVLYNFKMVPKYCKKKISPCTPVLKEMNAKREKKSIFIRDFCARKNMKKL